MTSTAGIAQAWSAERIERRERTAAPPPRTEPPLPEPREPAPEARRPPPEGQGRYVDRRV